MAVKLYEESNIQDIANAIRSKNKSTTKYKVSEMANAINSIVTDRSVNNDIYVSAINTYHSTNVTRSIALGGKKYNQLMIYIYDISDRLGSYSNIEISSGIDTSLWSKGSLQSFVSGTYSGAYGAFIKYTCNAEEGSLVNSINITTTASPANPSAGSVKLQFVVIALYKE